MRSYLLLTTLLAGACYNPTYVPGQVECGPGGACPEGFVCRTDNRCWRPGGDEVDMSGSPPADLSMSRPDGGGDDMTAPPTPFLRARAGRIVDGAGREVRLTGVSWFGMEGPSFAPLGLSTRSLGAILDTVKSLGYNVLRLPISNQLLDPASRVSGIGGQNPDLMGLSGQQMLDKVIEEAGKRGLRVVLVRYAAAAAQQTGLWYTENYPEQRWIGDWTRLAMRYRNTPTVVAFDLHQEPHDPAVWGGGSMTLDWRLAAERAGSAILAVHPELLIVVQGVGEAAGTGYWWGGNLKGVKTAPVRLPADRLVYGTNDYPRSVVNQPWFQDGNYPNNLPALWDDVWGYLMKDPDPAKNTPVMIVGFGGKLDSSSDRQWIGKLGEYITQNRVSFAYWCLNPDPFYGGVLGGDWATAQERQDSIRPLLAPPIP